MGFPPNWQTPITSSPGQLQLHVDPLSLLPSRPDLSQVRLDTQRALVDAGIQRHTPVQVTLEGVIWDGHHAARVAAEKQLLVVVKVVTEQLAPTADSILDLPVG
jgi:hypothetical protein